METINIDPIQYCFRQTEYGDFASVQKIAHQLLSVKPNQTVLGILIASLLDQSTKEFSSSLSTLSPIDRFVAEHFVYFQSGHFDSMYKGWGMKRVRKLIEVYGIEFAGKRVLELGAGIGSIGSIFADMGAEVIGLEGRAINCNLAKLRFRNLKNYHIVQWDLEKDITKFGWFDLIINFAVVEVVSAFEQLLDCCMKMSDTIFLETMVCKSTDPYEVVYYDMDNDEYSDWPLSGKSPRPSPAFIERLFTDNGFKVSRHFDGMMNTVEHAYDWDETSDETVHRELRRYWSFTKESLNQRS